MPALDRAPVGAQPVTAAHSCRAAQTTAWHRAALLSPATPYRAPVSVIGRARPITRQHHIYRRKGKGERRRGGKPSIKHKILGGVVIMSNFVD